MNRTTFMNGCFNGLNFLLVALLGLFLRGWLVQLSFNSVGPKLLGTGFNQLTLMDAVVLVILVQNLFK